MGTSDVPKACQEQCTASLNVQCVRDRKMGAQHERHGQRAEQDAAKLQRWPGGQTTGDLVGSGRGWIF